jgi:hypothetical protein
LLHFPHHFETEFTMPRFAFALVALLALSAGSSAAEPKLTPEDARYLDKLIADFLFDPTGAEWVSGLFPHHSHLWSEPGTRGGWLVRGKGGAGHRVFFTDGDNQPAPPGITGADFVAACKARYIRPERETENEAFDRMLRCASVSDQADLTLAAWLHRLGHDDLAARALAAARTRAAHQVRIWKVPGPRALLRRQLAESLAFELLDAYERRADEVALERGNKLFKLYLDVVRSADWRYWQVESIVADLHRRNKAGTLGQRTRWSSENTLPDETAQRVAALIEALEDVTFAINQFTLSFETLRDDWRIKALVAVGEPAVPALVDAFEKDARRTRSAQHPSVREPILLALEGIMRVQVVKQLTNEELLGYPGGRADTVKEAAAQLRTHWQTFGKFPFDERMMKILTDPRSGDRVCRDAARNLVERNTASNAHWFPMLFGNRVIAKFSNPTAAEAILAARDRHLKPGTRAHEPRPGGNWTWETRWGDYLGALVALGDHRIGPAVAKRAAAETDMLARVRLASAAFQLAAPEPLEALAKELERGTLRADPPAPPPDRPHWQTSDEALGELGHVICELAQNNSPAVDRSLWALADPKHPHHRATVALLVRHSSAWQDEEELFRHPYWIAVARQALGDTTLTGRTCKFEDGRLVYAHRWNTQLCLTPDELADPKVRRDRADERVCDRLAAKLSRSLLGAPAFHPLHVESEGQFAGVVAATGRYERRYRRLTWIETSRLSRFDWRSHFFVPDIKPLNRAATADDVASGDAVFHLSGKGKPANVPLPAWVTLKDKSCGLAVQAEIDATGTTVYGVICKSGMRAVPESEVDKVEPVAKK